MTKQPSNEDKSNFQRAMRELNGGDPVEAIRLFEQVRTSWRDDPDIWYLEGLAYGKLGEPDRVREVSERALELAPTHFGALCNLANSQMYLGDSEAALECYRKALEIQPDAPEVLDNYGRALGMLGRREEAIAHYRKALESRQDFAPAHASLGKAYSENGDPESAAREFHRALQLDPNDYGAHLGMAQLYSAAGGLPDAERHYREAIRIEKRNFQPYSGLANVERYRGGYDKALELLEQAQNLAGIADPRILAFKADTLERMGKTEQAYEIVNDLAQQDKMSPTAVAVYSRLCRQFGSCDDALELIDLSVDLPATDSMEKQSLLYAAGTLLDKLGRHDEAFDYFRRANETVRSPIIFNYREKYDRLIACFSKEAMAHMPRATSGSARPIFILGMPRSGTTLTEQILSSHPDVYGAGELPFIKQLTLRMCETESGRAKDYTERMAATRQDELTVLANTYLAQLNELNSEARYVTDKLPHNFQHVGLISLLFPEARIIHCRRNALDNCISIYFQSFIWTHDYAADLGRIGEFYKEYDRLMRHWEDVVDIPMMTVQYEDMIEDQESLTRQLIEFCGLEWDESVMKFHESGRTVATASYDQVRQPIYKTSKARWKNYAEHIGPLLDALPAHSLLGIEGIEEVRPSLKTG